jgi:hypothetical protein
VSVAAIRTAIVGTLQAVPDIGRVHAYQRYAHNLQHLAALYRSEAHEQLRGWNVSRVATGESGNRQAHNVEIVQWRVLGVMALNDLEASELAFDQLIEAVRNQFAQDETLGGTVAQCSDPDNADGESGIQLEDMSPGMFAGVLCHLARLRLLTVRYLDRSNP